MFALGTWLLYLKSEKILNKGSIWIQTENDTSLLIINI
jgi:hypothetical protein